MSDSIQILGKLLDVCEMRHKVLAGNIANVNTPNYARKEVRFQDALKAAVQSGLSSEVEKFRPEVVVDRTRPGGAGGRNVSLQDELSAMSENSLLYGVAARVLNGKYAGLRKAISGK